MAQLYIGIMSGTSLDGIDVALVAFENATTKLVASYYQPFDKHLKQAIQHISAVNTPILLTDYGALDTKLGYLFAEAVNTLLANQQISASAIKAIGSHGQTIYHAPKGQYPFSLQIGDPSIIAQQTGITTIADFRRKDIAAGGQGAPLVPAFHKALFSHEQENRCIVNIGGIANITLLPNNANAPVLGFDTGMGNTLLDLWIERHIGVNYDAQGAWARSGNICFELITHWLKDPYFHAPPPKSTGKEYFSLTWLENNTHLAAYLPQDIQASLCALTALSITQAIHKTAANTQRVLVCGGGVHNHFLLELLAAQLNCPLESTGVYGISPDYVEAMAFAWLARQTLLNLSGNLPAVTGASKEVILGGIYKA